MGKTSDFFKPTWKKLGWFILVVFVAQMYEHIVQGAVPVGIISNFINFVLNPATLIFDNYLGIDPFIARPFADTFNVAWQYLIGTIMAKEISKDKD